MTKFSSTPRLERHAAIRPPRLLRATAVPEGIGARDVPEHHRPLGESPAKAPAELAHAARLMSLGALTASIVHELTQPLSGIQVNACACSRLLDCDSPDLDGARETARLTVRDSMRAVEVIRRLRVLFSKQDVSMDTVDLNGATNEVLTLLAGELRRCRVVLRLELQADLPPVTGDSVLLQQVILNLLQNATDAMRGVEGRPRDLVIRTELDGGDRIRLSVTDAGVGVEAERIQDLFEPFSTTKNNGLGIGLAVSRSIVESHQGHLCAAPNAGPGTTFSFSLPRSRAQVLPSSRAGGRLSAE